jgi:hypothetical protein
MISIRDILLTDLRVISESSGVVRESGELLNRYYLPAIKQWIALKGEFPKTLGVFKRTRIKENRYEYDFPIPSYWRVAHLRGEKTLVLILAFEEASFFGVSGAALDPKVFGWTYRRVTPELTIKIHPTKKTRFDGNFLSEIHKRIKGVLTHELTHFGDERTVKEIGVPEKEIYANARSTGPPRTSPRSSEEQTALLFGYYTHPREIRAKAHELVINAKRRGLTFQRVVDGFLSNFKDKFSAQQLVQLRQLYIEEWKRRYPNWAAKGEEPPSTERSFVHPGRGRR